MLQVLLMLLLHEGLRTYAMARVCHGTCSADSPAGIRSHAGEPTAAYDMQDVNFGATVTLLLRCPFNSK